MRNPYRAPDLPVLEEPTRLYVCERTVWDDIADSIVREQDHRIAGMAEGPDTGEGVEAFWSVGCYTTNVAVATCVASEASVTVTVRENPGPETAYVCARAAADSAAPRVEVPSPQEMFTVPAPTAFA